MTLHSATQMRIWVRDVEVRIPNPTLEQMIVAVCDLDGDDKSELFFDHFPAYMFVGGGGDGEVVCYYYSDQLQSEVCALVESNKLQPLSSERHLVIGGQESVVMSDEILRMDDGQIPLAIDYFIKNGQRHPDLCWKRDPRH